MSDLHLPWLELLIVVPLLGALWVSRLRDANIARKWCLIFTGITFAVAVGAWEDFGLLHATAADDPIHLIRIGGRELFTIDQFSAPLLPLVALLYFLTTMATLRTKIRRFSFSWTLVSEAIALATFSCREPWGVVVLMSLSVLPPIAELVARGKPLRVFAFHMALSILLMVLGLAWVESEQKSQAANSFWAMVPLLAGVLIRCGIAPFHCWITELFEHSSFGTALLFMAPIVGAYGVVRLVLPVAPDTMLRSIGIISLVTAVYASGMALVQQDARRFFSYLFLSHSSLVLVGLEAVTPISLTGALCMWLSAGLALCGFGLVLRALESRRGRLYLTEFQGLYEHMPNLAMLFVLTGLASVGFPGTFGFVGTEVLLDGAVEAYPVMGVMVVLATALNGIAVIQAYFKLFTGIWIAPSVSLKIGGRERFAVLTLALLILIGGLFPHPGIVSRHHAAEDLLRDRAERHPRDAAFAEPAENDPAHYPISTD